MAEEEVVVEQDQEVAQEPGDDISDVVEGFEPEAEEPEDSEPEAKEEVKEPVKPAESPANSEIETLKKQVYDLNRALHKTRKEKSEVKEEDPLTPEQLKTLLQEHKDDPATLYNIMDYIGKQAAKKTSAESFDAQKALALKNSTEKHLFSKFPELADETSPASVKVNEVRKHFNLDDHPAGAYFAASAIIADNIETIQKQWYEAGKAEGLKEKSESARKKGVKDNSLLSAGKPAIQKSSGLQGTMKSTADQLGLSPSQKKIMEQLIAKKKVEA